MVVKDITDLTTGDAVVLKEEEPLNPHSRLAERQKAKEGQVFRTEMMMTSRADVRQGADEEDAATKRRRELKEQPQLKNNQTPKNKASENKATRNTETNYRESTIYDLPVSIVKSNAPPTDISQNQTGVTADSDSDIDLSLSDDDAEEIRALFEDDDPSDDLQQQQGHTSTQKLAGGLPNLGEAVDAVEFADLENGLDNSATSKKVSAPDQALVKNVNIVKSSESVEDLSSSVRQSSVEISASGVELQKEGLLEQPKKSTAAFKGVASGRQTLVDPDLVEPILEPILDPIILSGPAAVVQPAPAHQQASGLQQAVGLAQIQPPASPKFQKKENSKLRNALVLGLACVIALSFGLMVVSFVWVYLSEAQSGTSKTVPKRRIIRPGFEDKVKTGFEEWDESADEAQADNL